MKFATLLTTLFAAVTAVLGAEIVSPTPGQTLPVNKPFNLTYISSHVVKEHTIKVTVLTSAPFSTGNDFPAGISAQDVKATRSGEDGAAIYSLDVEAVGLTALPTGPHKIYVLESYAAYGGSFDGLDVSSVPVIFV
ncbi:hypothetical protein R3P38DRAFT_3265741 [Favolaschia claudopus]|uniref:Uncharacterized protein n=1 Tax=Favolaschia claudopus TaxID=2862362 RepID=A0AAW0BXK4_9AGAR